MWHQSLVNSPFFQKLDITSFAKKGGTITLSSNDQPSIGEVQNALGACSQKWEHFGSEIPKVARFGSGSKGGGGTPLQHRFKKCYCRFSCFNHKDMILYNWRIITRGIHIIPYLMHRKGSLILPQIFW